MRFIEITAFRPDSPSSPSAYERLRDMVTRLGFTVLAETEQSVQLRRPRGRPLADNWATTFNFAVTKEKIWKVTEHDPPAFWVHVRKVDGGVRIHVCDDWIRPRQTSSFDSRGFVPLLNSIDMLLGLQPPVDANGRRIRWTPFSPGITPGSSPDDWTATKGTRTKIGQPWAPELSISTEGDDDDGARCILRIETLRALETTIDASDRDSVAEVGPWWKRHLSTVISPGTRHPGQESPSVEMSVAAADRGIVEEIGRAAFRRERLPLRLVKRCDDCHVEHVVNPDYEQMKDRNDERAHGTAGVGVGAVASMSAGLAPVAFFSQLFKDKPERPSFVCPRCQGLSGTSRAAALCHSCGKVRLDPLLGPCPHCGADVPDDGPPVWQFRRPDVVAG